MCGSATQPGTPARIRVAYLLQVVGLGLSAVSILLPATAGLLTYYLRDRDGQSGAILIISLARAIGWFALSLVVGLWNAYSFVVQFEGETAVWNKRHVAYPVAFVLQFLLIVLGVGWTTWAFVGGASGVTQALRLTYTPVFNADRLIWKEPRMDLLEDYKNQIQKALLVGERFDDLRMTIEITAQERALFWKRTEPLEDDIVLSICGWCIPIPICPSKAAQFTNAIRAIRLKQLTGIAGNEMLQQKVKMGLTKKFLSAKRDELVFRNVRDFIMLDEPKNRR